jgi:hypothetical protein
MSRITCRTPSTGKPLRISQANVPTTNTTIAEAPDFSVPDASEKFSTRDPVDDTRAIRPGEIFFLTPLSAKNKTSSTQWIEVSIVTEDSITIEFGKIEVPAYDTALIPIQGRSLFKRDAAGTYGDRLIVKAQNADTFDVWASGEEKLSNEHAGVV